VQFTLYSWFISEGVTTEVPDYGKIHVALDGTGAGDDFDL